MKKIFLFSWIVLGLAACNTEVVTENGFVVDFHKDVEGPVAGVGDQVMFHYAVSNGEEILFDSRTTGELPQTSIPESIDPSQNTSAVLDALKMCSVGDSLTVYYPIDSMTGPLEGFEGKEHIIYTITLEDRVDAAEWAAEQQELAQANQVVYLANKTFLDETVASYKAGELDGQMMELPGGLQIMIHEEGEGELPENGQFVSAHYLGVFAEDGSEFDNSFMGGVPLEFPLGRGGVIDGWDLGFAQLKKGAKATMFIPSALAYGAEGYPGAIPPNSDLIFYVEMIDFQ